MTTSIDKIKVLLVDDQKMIRQGFSYVIGLQDDMEIVGEAADGREAVKQALALRPDIILMDIQMPNMTGIEASQAIIKQLPDVRIVILTTFNDPDYIYEVIRSGAVGYLLKDADVEDMLEAVRSAYRGEAVYRTDLAAGALSRAISSTYIISDPAGSDTPLLEPLTEREMEILQEMAYGLRNDRIAQKLFISEGTVKSHVHRILQKFGCEDRTQVVVNALRRGMVK
ncbi:LuxR family two component transcriptional regulator [Paenibacillus cellulosilyticus]|uniref:LuxR family two component transcriptional regulator n=1 Tax=Paenibacillus cellulosilyticus TaxID=375489 RepID=A0A2V2YSJ8_9BACL|nr:LuxR family two component transcriptional regulator [Paenibacillus cellulosilyticus]QKS48812.1 response regulator transcription factor [Paenibacillus cellulosilyticus]